MDLKAFALLAAVTYAVFWLAFRRLLTTWNVLSAFWVTNFIIIILGVLTLPFFPNAMAFSNADMSLIREGDIAKAIALNIGGAFIIVVTYLVSRAITTGRLSARGPNLLAESDGPRLGFGHGRLVVISAAAALYPAYVGLSNFSLFVQTTVHGLLGGDNAIILAGRRMVGGHYLYVLSVFNALPFLALALFIAWRLRGGVFLGLYAIAYAGCALAGLLLTFQKRPAIVFLLLVLLAEVWVRNSRQRTRIWFHARRFIERVMRRRKLAAAAAVAGFGFAGLMTLYYIHLRHAWANFDLNMLASRLFQVSFQTVVFGLSIPAIMQCRFFPAEHPFYGVSNIGLFARIQGTEPFPNTVVVYRFFYVGGEEGSVAVPALMDFYGAFGLAGYFLGAVILGIIFERLDTPLGRVERTGATVLLALFMFVFAYYLSHASLANSLLGYGGGIWLALWLALVVPIGGRQRAPSKTRA